MEGESIVIEINPKTLRKIIPHVIYLLIIIALGIFLFRCYTGGGSCDGSEDVEVIDLDAQSPPGVIDTPVNEPKAEAEPNCSDLTLNQDETDIDCGGTCGACLLGKDCLVDDDCKSELCTKGVCTAPPELTGKFDMVVKDVDIEPLGPTFKITGIDIEFDNGLASNKAVDLWIYLKTYDEKEYLKTGNEDPLTEPYLTLTPAVIPSGKTIREQYDVKGGQIFGVPTVYSAGEDFSIEVVAVERSSHDEVDTAKYKVRV